MNAAIYARYSSDNQRDESIDAQIRAIEEYAKRNNISIVKIYTDKAKSATSDKRPDFQQMIADSSLGIFNAIIVHKLDRFSRDKYDSVSYKRKLKRNGVRLISVTEQFDDSPESIILESLLEGMAEYYSKNLAREVMKGMKETAYQCKHTGGLAPLGYDVGPDKKYIVNDNEAIIVRIIFDMYVTGHGYGSIVSYLNSNGYKTKIGKPFGKNSLHDILANEKYCGTYVFNRSSSKDGFGKRNTHEDKDDSHIIRIPGGMPAIVSEETFSKVKAKMKQNKRRPGSYKAKENYLLSGLIFCGECGHAMQGNSRLCGRNKSRYISYRCGNKDRTKTCNNKEISKEYIEAFVLAELEKKVLNDKAVPYLVKRLNAHLIEKDESKVAELTHLNTVLAETEKQIDNIVAAISQGFVQDSFREKMTELEANKTQLQVKIQELHMKSKGKVLTEDEIRKLFSAFNSFVADKNIPECKKFIASYVNQVIVYKDRVAVTMKVFVDDGDDLHLFSSKKKPKRYNRASSF